MLRQIETPKQRNKRAIPTSSSSSESPSTPSPASVQKSNPLKKIKTTMDLSDSVKSNFKSLFEDNNSKTAELIKQSEERTVKAVKAQSDLVQSVLKQIAITEASVSRLSLEIQRISKKDRMRNIVIFGVSESATEQWTEVDVQIANIASKLGIAEIDYDQAFRLGKKTAGKVRPILVKLLRTRDRFQIMGLRNRLKGTKIFINDDKDPQERQKDSILRKKQAYLRKNSSEHTGTSRD
jgi:hypothetical protein